MIGHRQIIDARSAGWKPQCVFFHIGPAPVRGIVDVPNEGELDAGYLPTVYTNGDNVATVDLRWMVGLRVHVLPVACSPETFWKWWDAGVEAKPDHAFGLEPDGEILQWRAS